MGSVLSPRGLWVCVGGVWCLQGGSGFLWGEFGVSRGVQGFSGGNMVSPRVFKVCGADEQGKQGEGGGQGLHWGTSATSWGDGIVVIRKGEVVVGGGGSMTLWPEDLYRSPTS